MERLSDDIILKAWEVGADRGSVDRPLALLWAGGINADQDFADLPLAIVDRHLLELRAKTFGDTLPCMASCPECEEALEMELSAQSLLNGLSASPPGTEDVTLGNHHFHVRPVTSRDMADISECLSLDEVKTMLRKRICGMRTDEIPLEILPDLDSIIEARESYNEIALTLNCINCAHTWTEILDIGGFFWTELEAHAMRLLSEISEIARAFSWSEQEILALSPHRRRAYLTLARMG